VYQAPPQPAPGYAQPSPPSKGFFGSLFDFSFTSFVAPKIIKFLFVLLIILVILAALGMIVMGLQAGTMGIVFVILAPIAAFLYLLIGRVWLEVMMVLFRIAENTGEIAKNSRR
jgi:hypothetical protein